MKDLNYESWIVIDTKTNSHGIARQFIGMTYSQKAAEEEAGYFNWSWGEEGRFKAIKAKISFEAL